VVLADLVLTDALPEELAKSPTALAA
jgi:hypothetical protein